LGLEPRASWTPPQRTGTHSMVRGPRPTHRPTLRGSSSGWREASMVPRGARIALLIGCVALGVFGAIAFVAPDWATARFPGTGGPFLGQAVGGGALGAGAFAALPVRPGRVTNRYPLLAFLAIFGVAELFVAFQFRDRLATQEPLAWPYLVGLAAVA